MGLDGLSVSNLGLFKGVTPAEVTFQAEQLSQQQSEVVIKKIDELDKSKVDIEDGEQEETNYEGRDSEKKEEEQEEDNFDEIILKNHNNLKKYKVKFNQITDMVELIDQSTGFVVETITPTDLINLVSKSKNSSGILIDHQI